MTEAETAMLAMLLTTENLPEGWTLFNAGTAEANVGGKTFCNADQFSRPEDIRGIVEAEFAIDPNLGPLLNQRLTAYSEATAIEAFENARQIMGSCTEWTSEENGVTFHLTTVEVEPRGDESMGMFVTYDVEGVGLVTGNYYLARVGGILMVVNTITLGEAPFSGLVPIAETAVERIVASEFRP